MKDHNRKHKLHNASLYSGFSMDRLLLMKRGGKRKRHGTPGAFGRTRKDNMLMRRDAAFREILKLNERIQSNDYEPEQVITYSQRRSVLERFLQDTQ